MSKIFAFLAVLLILSGVIVLAVPRAVQYEAQYEASPRAVSPDAVAPKALAPKALAARDLMGRVRDIAEQANAPLSILFGLVSLYYSRRSYHINRAQIEAVKSARS